MQCFLTSSPCLDGSGAIDPANGFLDALTAALPRPFRALFVTAAPDDPAFTAMCSGGLRESFVSAGLAPAEWTTLARENAGRAAALVARADLVVLGGGHVPTEWRFFEDVGLRDLLRGFSGTVLGISAGSMNAASTVYCIPEMPGEAADPAFRRFLPGLGLTDAMILPHLNKARRDVLDGQRVFEDIAFADSDGRLFLAIPDGSWLHVTPEGETLHGEAHAVADGAMRQIASRGDRTPVGRIRKMMA